MKKSNFRSKSTHSLSTFNKKHYIVSSCLFVNSNTFCSIPHTVFFKNMTFKHFSLESRRKIIYKNLRVWRTGEYEFMKLQKHATDHLFPARNGQTGI